MRLGIGSYSFNWWSGVPGFPQPAQRLTPAKLLETAAELGIHVVQIADNMPLHVLSATELDQLRAQADRLKISLEVGTGGLDADNLRRYVEISRRLGSPMLRTVIDHGGERPTPEQVVSRLKPLMPVFEQADVVLAIENHDRFRATQLLWILNQLNSRGVGICLDTANSLGCMEGIDQVMSVLAPKVVNFHVKDVTVARLPHKKGFVVEGCAAGKGHLDIPDLLRRLREAGVDPNAIIELWSLPEATIEDAVAKEDAWVRESVAYMRQLIPN